MNSQQKKQQTNTAIGYFHNGDSFGLIYDGKWHSYVQFNLSQISANSGHDWKVSPKNIHIVGTNIILNVSLWGRVNGTNSFRAGIQGDGLINLLRKPSQFILHWFEE